ncbi:MAG: FeoA family protein [Eubacteriales bacterium]|jgi:ferrous iron transport protein A|nr:FeoA family protein [Eubacteriales bacterium]
MALVKTDLYDAPENQEYLVCKVPNISILCSLGIYPGTVIGKIKKFKLGGPVLINLATRKIALGKDIAKDIVVTEV